MMLLIKNVSHTRTPVTTILLGQHRKKLVLAACGQEARGHLGQWQ